jgi:hypothetical protein
MLLTFSIAEVNSPHFENFVPTAKRLQRSYRRFHHVGVIA